MSSELIIDVTSKEIVIALLENKQLVELNKERRNPKFAVGDIYLGKVKRIIPGLNAAFVDVGYSRDAFLHYLDLGPQFRSLDKYLKTSFSRKNKVPPLQRMKMEPDIDKNGKISNVLSSGQTILVQIAKEPISTKGPRLTSEISIAGRNLVLIPFSDKISISQKIASSDERKRLKRLIKSIKPKNYGVIIRTVAEGKKVATLDRELKGLVKKWEAAFSQLSTATVPKLVLSELDRTSALLRDLLNVSFSNIYVNDPTFYHEIKEYIGTIAPEKKGIVKLYDGPNPIFDQFGVSKQIKALFGRTVSFKNGAYLIIEHTEALHTIDVNSGNRSKLGEDQETNALKVNLAAAKEIARQLRLRDIGGIIVVDFIDMNKQEHKQKLYETMKEEMKADRTKHSILPLTKFGLLQITRQRVRPEMNIQTVEKCPTCKGSGETRPAILLVDEIENYLKFLVRDLGYRRLTLKTHPYITGYLKYGFPSIRWKWQLRYKIWLRIKGSDAYDFLHYNFFSSSKEPIKEN
ncbi:MAG: Rne/Rng family ribonuclease [Bacteroidales bacterium]|nr:Rne/Rng family ribonuclease [Bacteroidales bacterium]MBS3773651.1 Rne/Rng family ribonuclease [Bacteroidales bacterium]